MQKSLAGLYAEGEAEKNNRRKYSRRIIKVEKTTFAPLHFLTTGGMGPECSRVNKRLAELTSMKTSGSYSLVIKHLRTRLRFALLRATLITVRRVRGRWREDDELNVDERSFNLIRRALNDYLFNTEFYTF